MISTSILSTRKVFLPVTWRIIGFALFLLAATAITVNAIQIDDIAPGPLMLSYLLPLAALLPAAVMVHRVHIYSDRIKVSYIPFFRTTVPFAQIDSWQITEHEVQRPGPFSLGFRFSPTYGFLLANKDGFALNLQIVRSPKHTQQLTIVLASNEEVTEVSRLLSTLASAQKHTKP